MESIDAWYAIFLIAAGVCGCYVSAQLLKRMLYQHFKLTEGDGRKMEGRGFAWHTLSPVSAYLEGPEPHMVAALIVPEYGPPEEGQTGWRVMSETYSPLNYLETEIFDLDLMIRAVNTKLGNELKKQKELLEEDMDNVLCMVFRGEEEHDPYEC